jgi:hypothetical protein
MRLGLKNFPDWRKQNLLWFLTAPVNQRTGQDREKEEG